MFDFLGDEDSHIQIDAIEAFIEIIEEISEEQIRDDFVPCFLLHIDLEGDKDFQIELTERIASIFGLVLFKLKKYDIHIKYKD